MSILQTKKPTAEAVSLCRRATNELAALSSHVYYTICATKRQCLPPERKEACEEEIGSLQAPAHFSLSSQPMGEDDRTGSRQPSGLIF